MADDLWKSAERMARRLYAIEIKMDKMPDGNDIYVVYNPDLPGCMAHGDTLDEAIALLDEVRLDYINALLEEGIPFPAPQSFTTSSQRDTVMNVIFVPGRSEGSIEPESEKGRENVIIKMGGDLTAEG